MSQSDSLQSPRPGRAFTLVFAVCSALLGSACITVTQYQPLQSLQKPVVVDPSVENFAGANFLVRCIPGEAISQGDAAKLCTKVGALFRNQGAEVEEEIPTGSPEATDVTEEFKPDLIIDLRSRKTFADEGNTILTYASVLTLTLIPAVTEEDFAADVTIRDPNGFLLASDTLHARFVNYLGIGVYAVNWVLDVAVRPDDEEVTGNGAQRQFSNDYYRQLSQLVLDAQMRMQVLRGFENRAKPAAARGAN